MARRTKAQALETRERILDAAVEVFHERGVAQPSLTDIARLAGVTRGAVYGHFKNKSDVFNALCDRIRLPDEAICADGGDAVADQTPLARLRSGWIAFLRQAACDAQKRQILAIIIHRSELLEDNGRILQRLREGRREGMARLTALIAEAVDQGQLPAQLDVPRAALYFHGAIAGLLSDWLFDPSVFDLASESEAMVDATIETLRQAPSLHTAP